MVLRKSWAKICLLVGFSTAILLADLQRQVTASQPTSKAATVTNASPDLRLPLTIADTQLPPIGEPSQFIPGEDVRLVIRLKERRVYLYKDNQVKGSYPVAIGKAGWETPVGTYKVFSMEINPTFKSFKTGRIIPPEPDNPLGPRWIGFWTDGKTQLGFHGTNEPELIGEAVSHGCVRMHNEDVMALYEQVEVGTTVIVEP